MNKQTAVVPVYEFGAKAGAAAEATVLDFEVKEGQGGQIQMEIEADEAALTVSLQAYSADTAAWGDLAATEHGLDGADIAVPAKTMSPANFTLRPGSDTAFRVRVYGTTLPGRGRIKMRGSELLDIDRI